MSDLTAHAAFVIALVVIALIFFATERIRLQATALMTFVVLLAGFALVPFELADGSLLQAQELLGVFGNQALVTRLCADGAGQGRGTDPGLCSRWSVAYRVTGRSIPKRQCCAFCVGAAVFSAFLNNTPDCRDHAACAHYGGAEKQCQCVQTAFTARSRHHHRRYVYDDWDVDKSPRRRPCRGDHRAPLRHLPICCRTWE